MLCEPWALDLLKHAAEPHSPIDVDSLPMVDQTEPLVLSRLHDFEDQNLLKSCFERRGKTIRRMFHITPLGKQVVSLATRIS
jgi:DNA-binding PadR family transcriptional regulator